MSPTCFPFLFIPQYPNHLSFYPPFFSKWQVLLMSKLALERVWLYPETEREVNPLRCNSVSASSTTSILHQEEIIKYNQISTFQIELFCPKYLPFSSFQILHHMLAELILFAIPSNKSISTTYLNLTLLNWLLRPHPLITCNKLFLSSTTFMCQCGRSNFFTHTCIWCGKPCLYCSHLFLIKNICSHLRGRCDETPRS